MGGVDGHSFYLLGFYFSILFRLMWTTDRWMLPLVYGSSPHPCIQTATVYISDSKMSLIYLISDEFQYSAPSPHKEIWLVFVPVCQCLRAAAGRIGRWWQRCSSADWRKPLGPPLSGTSARGQCRSRRNTRLRIDDPWSSPTQLQN